MAKEKEIKKDEELKEEEMLKDETNQEEENQDTDDGIENPPAEVEEPKKGFHPIKALKEKATKFGEDHPKIVSGAKTVGKVAAGVGIGAVGTVAILASIAKNRAEDIDDDVDDSDEDEDVIDSEATELDDEE